MTSVLVVEDDEMFARVVGLDLREQGFGVSIVHSVVAALEALSHSEVDVLLTDLRLGAQDGIDLLTSLRYVSPRTRAVLMSGLASARDYQRAIELGAVRVLCKPFTPTELIQCIRQAVECETGFRGSVHGLSLVDMIQMFNYGRRSVTIVVSGQSPGRLHLDDGQIIHVEHEGRTGEAALRTILAVPGGAFSTSVLLYSGERTVTRDFRVVVLDALRAIDEVKGRVVTGGDEVELRLYESQELAAVVPPGSVSTEGTTAHEQLLNRVREIDGYIAACLALSTNGGVISYDGQLDLRPVAPLTAEIVARNHQTISEMGLDDEIEDVLITATNEYHLVRSLHAEVPLFVHVVLDRSRANPAMARRTLESAARFLDL